MGITIRSAVKQLLHIVELLQDEYPKKKFTLDGRLVGDLGETLVATEYDVELFEGVPPHHDGQTSDGRKVQIKSTMKDSLTVAADHTPDHYLGIKIHRDGTFEEVFNGPGSIVWEAVKDRKHPKNNQHKLPIKKWRELDETVEASDRIPRRATTLI